MNLLEDLFAEYVNMRGSGMSATEVLKVLRAYVEPLSKAQKNELADFIREWEQAHLPPQHRTPATSKPAIKPLKRVTPQEDVPFNTGWIVCHNCNAQNRHDAVFCYACGHLLEHGDENFSTVRFSDAVAQDPHHFSADSVLVLSVREGHHDFELRPQLSQTEMVIGRSTANSAMLPDVDLAPYNAEKKGVSRLHLALKYEDEVLKVYDLGSANGSLINGQKLHPREIRVLANGDELQLGHLVIRVIYYHPGVEI